MANISVGSIYQYFPNKKAILVELMRNHVQRANALRPDALDAGDSITLAQRLQLTVRWHLDVRRQDPLLATRLFEIQRDVLTGEERSEFDRYHEQAVANGLRHHVREIKINNLDIASLIVSQMLLVTTQAVTTLRSELLDDPQYESEIVDALLGYLV